jgi:hypothetical protein
MDGKELILDFSRKIRVTIDSHWELGSHADWFEINPLSCCM